MSAMDEPIYEMLRKNENLRKAIEYIICADKDAEQGNKTRAEYLYKEADILLNNIINEKIKRLKGQ